MHHFSKFCDKLLLSLDKLMASAQGVKGRHMKFTLWRATLALAHGELGIGLPLDGEGVMNIMDFQVDSVIIFGLGIAPFENFNMHFD